MKNITFVFLFALFLSGCSSSIQLAQKDSNRIKSISFNQNVKIPDKVFYQGSRQTVGLMFGAIGILIAHSSETNDDLIMAHLKKNNINIGKIAIQEFEKQIKHNSRFANKRFVSNQENADATFVLEVSAYGIAKIQGFSNLYKPVLRLTGKLVDNQNKTIWEDYNIIASKNSNIQGIPFKTYLSKPGAMRKKFELITKNVVSLLIENL
ncbi:hypothetical protein BSPLISOX_2916 [uncultured Gammaproteobacteria bacterium]|jgi:hypothetical protein|nr:hypothetical protein [uncultured Gammaproteobacteria bacterium]VVH67307.1 hypothetical protein BSPLISOX_2916 [uncultured Gammaproteobacteria bacterium]